MNKTLEVGNYNVSFCGIIAETNGKNRKYQMVIIEKFDGNNYIENSKKVLYFLDSKETAIPKLNTARQINKFYAYKNNSKIKCEHEIKVTAILK